MESPIGSKLLCYEYAPSRCPNSWEDINEILLIILGLHFGDLRDFQKFLGRTPRGDASQEIDLAAHQCSFTHAVACINSHFHHTAKIKYEEAARYTILEIYVEFFVTILEKEFKVEGVYKVHPQFTVARNQKPGLNPSTDEAITRTVTVIAHYVPRILYEYTTGT